METRQLAGTDLHVGRVVFGTMTFGSQVELKEAEAMVARCRDAGITMFDTSNNYNGGASEEMLGKIVAGFRDEIQISTKVGSPVDQSDPELMGLGKKAIIRGVEDSLRRLGTDHIDVYYFHRPDRNTPFEVSLEAADEMVRSGKVRYIGQSNFAAWQIGELINIAKREGLQEMLISQPMYNLISRRIETEYAEASGFYGLSNIVYNPLAGGLLTGKHRPESLPDDGSRFTKGVYRDRYWNEQLFEAVRQLQQAADDAGLTLIELSFRWLLAQPLVTCMLLGASSLGQLEANLAALSGPAPDEGTVARCDDVWSRLQGASPNYNR
jgi:aryl-alcohol dehydrogenase-like predicted oxidoreductase